MLSVNNTIVIPKTEFHFSYSRSPGPGGQSVNKVNSKVTLRWDVRNTEALPLSAKRRFMARYGNRINRDGNLILTSHRYRDQSRNQVDILDKLRQLILAVASEPKKRKVRKRSEVANRKRLEQKHRNAETKRNRRSVRFDD